MNGFSIMKYPRAIAILTTLALLLLLLAACQARQPQSDTETVAATATATTPATAVTDPDPTATSPGTAVPDQDREPATETNTSAPATDAPAADAPRVVYRRPTSLAVADRQPTIELRFTQPMDADAVADALTIEPTLPFTVTTEQKTVFIHLAELMAFDTDYRFQLATTAVDQNGIPLNNAYGWHLSLRPPLSLVTGPSSAQPEGPIKLRFNYPMDDASVSQALAIKPDVSGKLVWSDDYQTATLTPDTHLQADTVYTISFTAPLYGRDGGEIPTPTSHEFTTPPAILSLNPQGESVRPTDDIAIRFDRLMDEAATEAAIQIEPPTPGTFSWNETTVTFQPFDGYLQENTSYTVTLQPQALGQDGEQLLDEAVSYTFTTGALADLANFGYGPNAQVLDANGRRAVQFQAFSRDTRTITFDLYQLTLTQFLDKYSSNFKSSWWSGDPDNGQIDTADAELVHSWQMETIDSPAEWANVQEVIIPGEVPPGLYILDLSVGRLNDQLILVLTENALAVKEAEGQIVAWVTDINGDPVPGITVGIYARNGDLLAEGNADESGLFRTQLPSFSEGGPPAVEPLIVVANNGADVTVSGLSGEWQSSSGYRNWWWNNNAAAQSAAFVYTDRPIYKPGHDVYFKAVVRLDDDALLTLPPAGTAVTVRIRDGRDNVVQTFDLATNDFGTVNGVFHLAEGAMLGRYEVEVELAGTRHQQAFKVEDYRKPDYQVTVTTDAEQYLAGDTIAITVDTAYFFGEPVANADVSVRRFFGGSDYGYGYGYGGARIWWEDWEMQNQPLTGQTDADGRFTLTMPVDEEDISGGNFDWGSSLVVQVWGLEATVNDGSNQTVSGFTEVRLYSAAERVSANSGSYVQKPGEPFTINATVETIFGQPVPNRALTIELGRWQRHNYAYDHVVQSASMTTDADGRASTRFTIEEPGYYQLRIFGTDAQGNKIQFTDYVYAFSDFYDAWYGRNEGGIQIDTDKESYAPGETAQLIVETTISGPALLTVERGGIRREQLVQLTAPLTLLDLPIEEGDIPNVYVAINAWEPLDTTIQEHTGESLPDGRLHSAYVNINVPADQKRLTVTITPDQEQVAPRAEAGFTVRVTNFKGEPVSAEVSLALVDEAIFALSEELSGPMMDAFYYQRDSLVNTYNSLQPRRYLWEGGMGGGGGDGGLGGGPRSDFPDTAAWIPVLHTDFNGEARVTITLPDNLTSWRLTAKATTADTQVGEATANITTWQPIIVRPILPRALTAGDSLQISALVHNYSDEAQGLAVSLAEQAADGESAHLEILAPVTQTLILEPGAVRVVGWTVAAQTAGDTHLLVQAQFNADVNQLDPGDTADAVLLPLQINPLAVPDVQTEIGQFNRQLQTAVSIPADALPMSVVEIQLSRSIAGSLLEGLEYLTGYPYGCVEQTMSRALPNAVVGRALNQLGVTNPTLQAELPGYINASVQRLYGFQHNDGGWGWWYDDATHDYQTAWVIFGLAQVAEAGYEVDPAVLERGIAWMNEELNRMDPRTRAFALYAMAEAGQPNEDATLALAGDQASLQGDVFSLASLALSLDAIGEQAMAREIVDGLAATAVDRNGMVHWQGSAEDGHYTSKTMASDIRSTALALSAFTQIRPGHELEGGIVRWLMSQRRSQGWGSTNETSFTILGLTDHLLATAFSEAAAETGYTVQVNGRVYAEGTLGRGAPAVTLRIPRDELQDGDNEIVVTQNGQRPLYYTINSRVYVAQAEIDAAGAIEITRVYLDPETNQPIQFEQIEAGQLVKVRLTVRLPEDGSYMIVEDRLPGGLEALNEGLNTTSRVADEYWQYYDDDYAWQGLGYNYKEIYGDRVSFFITEMNRGTTTFTYMARATHSGDFTAMPAEAYGMYNPALWGRSASDQLQIEAAE